MSGIMMSLANNGSPYPNKNTWTGTTTGLQLNLLNAPSAGTTWRDASGNNNIGTVRKIGTGSTTYVSTTNGGLTFASGGSTNAAMISTAYNLAAPWTVDIVANVTTTSGFPSYLFGNENQNTSAGWWAYFYSAAVFKIGSTSRENIYLLNSNVGIRQFTIVCNTSPSASMDLYINGVLQTPNSASYGLAPSAVTNGLNFNSDHPALGTANTPNDTGTGTFYQMRAYNIALSSTQVTANYNAVKTTYGI